MNLFIKKSIYYLIFILIFPIVIHCLIGLYYNYKNSNNTIFIWGDSQTYSGLDLAVLNEETGKMILSAAQRGAGVYDFLVFTQYVPPNSTVLVAISKPVQIRPKNMDINMLGLSLNALLILYQNDYSFNDIFNIAKKNVKFNGDIFETTKPLYPYADTIVYLEPISEFENQYKDIPVYIRNKQNIIIEGIKILQKKNCNIFFIEFPYHPILTQIENKSPIKPLTDKFTMQVLNLFKNKYTSETIQLDTSRMMMYDLTHLNEIGAIEVSRQLGKRMKTENIPKLFIVKWQD
jgi:hypothetical protein